MQLLFEITLQIVKCDNKSFKIPCAIDMHLELLVVELVELLVLEEPEESLLELRDVVSPVFVELHRHHDQVELPGGDKVRHDEGADGGGSTPPSSGRSGSCRIRRTVGPANLVPLK